MATAPRWQKENWSEAERRGWTEKGKVIGATSLAPWPWMTVDLPGDHQYLALDGFEIRPVATVGRRRGALHAARWKDIWA